MADADEPFQHLFHQGMVLHNGEKMSKSRGNVVGIDETAHRRGIDAMRLFLLYVTPPEETSDWSDEGITGRIRLLNRIWRACEPFFGEPAATEALAGAEIRRRESAAARGTRRGEIRDRRDAVATVSLQCDDR